MLQKYLNLPELASSAMNPTQLKALPPSTSTLFFFEAWPVAAPVVPSVYDRFNYPLDGREVRVRYTGDFGYYNGQPCYNISIDEILYNNQFIYWSGCELNPQGILSEHLPIIQEVAKDLVVAEFKRREPLNAHYLNA